MLKQDRYLELARSIPSHNVVEALTMLMHQILEVQKLDQQDVNDFSGEIVNRLEQILQINSFQGLDNKDLLLVKHIADYFGVYGSHTQNSKMFLIYLMILNNNSHLSFEELAISYDNIMHSLEVQLDDELLPGNIIKPEIKSELTEDFFRSLELTLIGCVDYDGSMSKRAKDLVKKARPLITDEFMHILPSFTNVRELYHEVINEEDHGGYDYLKVPEYEQN